MRKFVLIPAKKTIILFVLSVVLLFLSFFYNFFQVAANDWFQTEVRDGDSFILARLVKSRQNGIFSSAGLTGSGYINSTNQIKGKRYPFQYNAYMENQTFENYVTYDSQIGGQGIFLSTVDKVLPFNSYLKLRIFYGFTAVLTAMALSSIVVWFYGEFGLFTSVFVLLTMILSRWLVVYGNRIFWQTWAFYLPMISVMYFLKYKGLPEKRGYLKFGLVIFSGVVIKCLFNGYEFITTTLVMMVVPFVYYSLLKKSPFSRFAYGSLVAAINASLAILLTLIILCAQISIVEGGIQKGIDYVTMTLEKRTYGDPADFPQLYAASLNAKVSDVLAIYLTGTYFDFNRIFQIPVPANSPFGKVRYWYLLGLFLIGSIYLYLTRKKFLLTNQKGIFLIYTTWFSILAPFSWFIIFKSHAYIHYTLDFITWQMPFTLFGFAICGLAIQNNLSRLPFLIHRGKKLTQEQPVPAVNTID